LSRATTQTGPRRSGWPSETCLNIMTASKSKLTSGMSHMRPLKLVLVMLVLSLIVVVNIVKWLAGDEEPLG